MVDTKFDGFLNPNSFAESNIRVTRDDANGNPVVSNSQPITGFTSTGGVFTFMNDASDPLFNDALVYTGDVRS